MSTNSQEIPKDLRYATSHEWVKVEGAEALVGVTAFAVHEMGGDIVHIDLPQPGGTAAQGDSFGVIDSVKAAFDLYSPVNGEIVAVNTALGDDPSPISQDPFGAGWMVKIRLAADSGLQKLMDAGQYKAHIAAAKH